MYKIVCVELVASLWTILSMNLFDHVTSIHNKLFLFILILLNTMWLRNKISFKLYVPWILVEFLYIHENTKHVYVSFCGCSFMPLLHFQQWLIYMFKCLSNSFLLWRIFSQLVVCKQVCVCLIDWLIDWLTDLLAYWPTDLLNYLVVIKLLIGLSNWVTDTLIE